MNRTLVLGSTSPFRRALLEKLSLPFICSAPDIDESRLPDEDAANMVRRLSLEKARAVATKHSDTLIIGSDQCAVLGENILGKPGDQATAIAQLKASSGRTVEFLTGLCLYDAEDASYQLDIVPYQVEFRDLTDAEIIAYLHHEKPYNCAGSIKSETLGISLFKRMVGDDPNALVGLPLIRLCEMLRAKGITVPA